MTTDERFIRHMLRLQFQINCLASVAIEYPALQNHPLLKWARDDR